MQASRTAHYAWLYRGSRSPISSRSRLSQGSQTQSQNTNRSGEVASKAASLRQRVSPAPSSFSRQRAPLLISAGDGRDLPAAAIVSSAMARAHFIEAQIRDAVQSGIRQMVWLGPRSTQAGATGAGGGTGTEKSFELGLEVEVFRLEEDALRAGGERGARAVLDRSLVRSARTLFVCDGLLDRTPSAQIQAILRTIGDSCFGSRFACLYLDRGLVSGNQAFGGSHKPRRAVPRLGDPTEQTEDAQLGLEMLALPGLLACAGLVVDADVSLSEYVRRVLGASASDLRSYAHSGCCRLVVAHVRARDAADSVN